MTGFFDPSAGGGLSPAPVTPESTDTGFFPSQGTPTLLTTPFDGVLKPSTASIGKVSVENFPATVAISNLPGTQRVEVSNWPSLQRVVLDFPAVQAVSLDFPAVQAVSGSLSISNLPAVQDVRIVASGGLLTALTAGTQHIGSVSIDGPVTGSVTVTNQPEEMRVSNFPATQAVTGTVAISNLPAPMTTIKVNNDAGSPIPVRIVDGSYQGGGSSTFDGNVTIKNGTAHIGSVSLDQPVTLASGSTVAVSSIPAISGTVTVANPVTSVAVTSLPSIVGTVSVANQPSSITINNAPGAPVPVALQGGISLTSPVALASGSTVAVSSIPSISGTVSITGTPKVAVQGTVPVSGTVAIDTSTPLQVTVTNPPTGGSFTIDNDASAPIPVVGPKEVITLVAPGAFPEFSDVLDIRGRSHVMITIAVTSDANVQEYEGQPVSSTWSGGPTFYVEGSTDLSTWTEVGSFGFELASGPQGAAVLGPFDRRSMAPPASFVRVRMSRENIFANDGVTPVDLMPFGGFIEAHVYTQTQVKLDPYTQVGISGTVNTVPHVGGSPVSATRPMPVKMQFAGDTLPNITAFGAQLVALDTSGTLAGGQINPIKVELPGVQAVSGTVSVNTSTAVAHTDVSGLIVTGGTSQVLAPMDVARRGAWVANNSSGDLWVCDVGPASIGGSSLRIPPGGLYEWPAHGVPFREITIIGATTGQSFAARVW